MGCCQVGEQPADTEGPGQADCSDRQDCPRQWLKSLPGRCKTLPAMGCSSTAARKDQALQRSPLLGGFLIDQCSRMHLQQKKEAPDRGEPWKRA